MDSANYTVLKGLQEVNRRLTEKINDKNQLLTQFAKDKRALVAENEKLQDDNSRLLAQHENWENIIQRYEKRILRNKEKKLKSIVSCTEP